MKSFFLLTLNYALFLFFAAIAAGMQTSLWLHIFGYLPAPLLLVPFVVYWTLYRSNYEAVLMTYLISMLALGFSGAPIYISLVAHVTVFTVVYLMKDRVLWSGPNSFMVGCFVSAFAMPPSIFLFSRLLELNPQQEFLFWNWLMSPLFTALLSFPLFIVFSALDKITEKEPPRDTESEVL